MIIYIAIYILSLKRGQMSVTFGTASGINRVWCFDVPRSFDIPFHVIFSAARSVYCPHTNGSFKRSLLIYYAFKRRRQKIHGLLYKIQMLAWQLTYRRHPEKDGINRGNFDTSERQHKRAVWCVKLTGTNNMRTQTKYKRMFWVHRQLSDNA